jgi:hypothetical protein
MSPKSFRACGTAWIESQTPATRGTKPTPGRAPLPGKKLHLTGRGSSWIAVQTPPFHVGEKIISWDAEWNSLPLAASCACVRRVALVLALLSLAGVGVVAASGRGQHGLRARSAISKLQELSHTIIVSYLVINSFFIMWYYVFFSLSYFSSNELLFGPTDAYTSVPSLVPE